MRSEASEVYPLEVYSAGRPRLSDDNDANVDDDDNDVYHRNHVLGLRSVGPHQPFICALRPTDYYPTISLKGRLSQEKMHFLQTLSNKRGRGGGQGIYTIWGCFLMNIAVNLKVFYWV